MKTHMLRCLAVLGLVASLGLATTAFANPFGGAFAGSARAPAFGARVHVIVYNGGEQADFSIRGDGTTTLNIIVRDANGFEVVRTSGPGDVAHVHWTPIRTATYYISVVNEGSVYNDYFWRAY